MILGIYGIKIYNIKSKSSGKIYIEINTILYERKFYKQIKYTIELAKQVSKPLKIPPSLWTYFVNIYPRIELNNARELLNDN